MAPTSTLPAADQDDWLGYGAYADALWSRIQTALIKSEGRNAVLGDDPLVIGVFGEWGAGKSKLLSLMQDRSRSWANERIGWRKRDGGNFGLTVPVYFQPWKYEHEAHLHVPILLHIFAALKRELESAQTWGEWAGGKVPPWITQHLDKVVSAFGMCLAGAAVALDLTVPLSSRAGIATAGFLAKVLPKASPKAQSTNPSEALQYSDSGRYFYEIHETLKAITRPYQHGKLLQGVNIQVDLPINFVIFIDDLDRCLPEKAVQTLELIKTIFNAESFAFVLALDDEVIERGIGHRYKDYELLNKKPSMPITGFEYLEKIVHLPFKLPALTRAQASAFVRKLEVQIAGEDAAKHWFRRIDDQNPQAKFQRVDLKPGVDDKGTFSAGNPRGSASFELEVFDLMTLALAGFDAFVPRKLSRMVELWHATVKVAQLRSREDSKKETLAPSTAAQVDVRLAFSLMLIQLFHSDLYRVLRRHEETFRTLYDGFDGTGENLSSSKSDIDLWHWAAYRDKSAKRPTSFDETLALISNLDDGSRYAAQQKRLPLVDCLVAHRKVQRHVFDALKLLGALKQQMPALPDGFAIAQYFSMLAQYDEGLIRSSRLPPRANATVIRSPDKVAAGRFTPLDPQQLYLSLIAADEGTQEAIAKNALLEDGKQLTKESVAHLAERVGKWLDEVAHTAPERRQRRVQLLRGLQRLAPFIAYGEAEPLWALAEKSVDLADEKDPKLRALWGDVRATLGCDPRFETGRLCLAVKNMEDKPTNFSTQGDEVPGFAKIDATNKPFWFGDGGTVSGEAVKVPGIDKVYYMARTLTTVDQYEVFVNSGDYAASFEGEGQNWLVAAYDSNVSEAALNRRHALRPAGQRN